MQITNGKVSFSRRLRPADFEGKEALIELSFNIDDGEDATAVVERVGLLAQEKALQLVGLKPAPSSASVSLVSAAPPSGQKEKAAVALNEAEKPKRPPGRPPAVKQAEPDPKQGNGADPEASAELAKAAHAAADPASVSDDDAILGTESVPEVTDKQLTDAITRRNGALQQKIGAEAPKKLRALIAKFAGPVPKQSRDIPQKVRQTFLAELDALS